MRQKIIRNKLLLNSRVDQNKILLIRPKNIFNYNNYPPLNLIELGTVLKNNRYDPIIINSALEQDVYQEINNHIAETLLIAITILTSEVPDALDLISHIKSISSVPIVVGGWHATLFAEQMAAYNLIDYVIIGEGEEHIIELAKQIETGHFPSNKILDKRIINLNTLPEPDYCLDPRIEQFISNYLTDPFTRHISVPLRWLPYETSRGCPSKCTFCINVVTNNNRYRKKDSEKVLDEIGNLVKKYNLTHIKFIDDNFFVDITRVREICAGIIEREIHITWDAECRCDYFNDTILNDRTLSLAKKSGLIQLTIGIESGSQHTLEMMKKEITVEQAEHAVKKCNQYKIIARSSFILEIPGETKEDIRKTIRFINKLRKFPYFSCGAGTFRPYPKCELTDLLIKEGYLNEPTFLEEWAKTEIINIYTAAEYIRSWQVDGFFSLCASNYVNMESATRVGTHQSKNFLEIMIIILLLSIAKIRNRLLWYRCPWDMMYYQKFLKNFYSKQALLEKSKSNSS